jgi:hypothetical protein
VKGNERKVWEKWEEKEREKGEKRVIKVRDRKEWELREKCERKVRGRRMCANLIKLTN